MKIKNRINLLVLFVCTMLPIPFTGCNSSLAAPVASSLSSESTQSHSEAPSSTSSQLEWDNSASVADTDAGASSGYKSVRITFNTTSTSRNPLYLDMIVPGNWDLKPVNDKAFHAAYSPVDIYLQNKKIGYVGNWSYEIPNGKELSYVSIYNQIMLGAHYNWNNEYTPIKNTELTCTATCRVFYDSNITEDQKEKYNDGILSYDNSLCKYIQMEIDDGVMTKEQIKAIASSVSLSQTK